MEALSAECVADGLFHGSGSVADPNRVGAQ